MSYSATVLQTARSFSRVYGRASDGDAHEQINIDHGGSFKLNFVFFSLFQFPAVSSVERNCIQRFFFRLDLNMLNFHSALKENAGTEREAMLLKRTAAPTPAPVQLPIKTPMGLKTPGLRRALGDITNKAEKTPAAKATVKAERKIQLFVDDVVDDIEYCPKFTASDHFEPEVEIDVDKILNAVNSYYIPPGRLPEGEETYPDPFGEVEFEFDIGAA